MKNNIALILLALFLMTLLSGCYEHRRDQERRERYHGENHGDEPGLRINIH